MSLKNWTKHATIPLFIFAISCASTLNNKISEEDRKPASEAVSGEAEESRDIPNLKSTEGILKFLSSKNTNSNQALEITNPRQLIGDFCDAVYGGTSNKLKMKQAVSGESKKSDAEINGILLSLHSSVTCQQGLPLRPKDFVQYPDRYVSNGHTITHLPEACVFEHLPQLDKIKTDAFGAERLNGKYKSPRTLEWGNSFKLDGIYKISPVKMKPFYVAVGRRSYTVGAQNAKHREYGINGFVEIVELDKDDIFRADGDIANICTFPVTEDAF